MAEPAPRPGRIAVVIMGGLLLAAIPYGWSVWTKSQRYQAYLDETLNRPAAEQLWNRRTLEPEACLSAGFTWITDCPGVREFCRRGFRQLVRTCMASQDRTAWCTAQDQRWATTTFGYTACETLEAETQSSSVAEAVADQCTHGYLILANHCQELASKSDR